MTVLEGDVDVAAFRQTGATEETSYATIMLANPSSSPQSLTLSLASSGLAILPNTVAQVLFENRTVSISSEGHLSDHVNGYATHVYQFHFTPPNPSPISSISVHPGNILRNPSFESQSNIGVADAMWPNVPSESSVALIDSVVALHGYYSQRMTNGVAYQGDQASISTYITAVPPNVEMTLSFWSRTLVGQMQIQVSSTCFDFDSVMFISSAWEEHQIPVLIPSPAQCTFKLTAVGAGTLWVDLTQLYPSDHQSNMK